jgi:hypothetical protein
MKPEMYTNKRGEHVMSYDVFKATDFWVIWKIVKGVK